MNGQLFCKKHNLNVEIIKFKDSNNVEYCPLCFKWKLFKALEYKTYHKEVNRFHNSTAITKVCWAPSRTTKSYSAAHELLPYCLLPGNRIWIVGPTYSLAEKEFRVVVQQLVDNRDKIGIAKPKIFHYNVRAGNLYIKWGHPGGDTILECLSATVQSSLLGDQAYIALYSEASQLSRSVRERFIMERVERELIPTTPFQSAEWVYDLCMEGQDPEFAGETESFHWDYTANPDYNVKRYKKARKRFGVNSAVFREQFLGDWVFYGGSVYPLFSEDSHVIEPFRIPEHWSIVRAIDFGAKDPFVCLWLAVGPSAELYCFQEYYHNQGPRSMKVHAQVIKEMSKGMKIIQTVGDPQAKQSIEDLCCEGIPTSPANNDRMLGRLKVVDYLTLTPDAPKPWPIKDIENNVSHPRLYIFNTVKHVLREMKYYRFKEYTKHKEGDKEATEGDDHAMDTLRYACMTRPSPFHFNQKFSENSAFGILARIKRMRMKRKRRMLK